MIENILMFNYYRESYTNYELHKFTFYMAQS